MQDSEAAVELVCLARLTLMSAVILMILDDGLALPFRELTHNPSLADLSTLSMVWHVLCCNYTPLNQAQE